MATYNGQDFTTFRGVNTRATIALRFAADVAGNESTLSVRPSQDTARAYFFPDKSGTFGITGTFSVDLPIVASSGYLSTIVTVAGIRAEDALLITPMNNGAAGAIVSARGVALIGDAQAGNGNITINFVNAFATATIARTSTFAYTAMR